MSNVTDFLLMKRLERERAGIVERRTIILPVEGPPPAPPPAPVATRATYEPSADPAEDNRRRRAAGLPERKGRWGGR